MDPTKMGIEFHVFGIFWVVFLGGCGFVVWMPDASMPKANSARCVFGILCLRICGLILQQQIVGPPKGVGRRKGDRKAPEAMPPQPLGKLTNWQVPSCLTFGTMMGAKNIQIFFMFIPKIGEMIPIWRIFFQMGWLVQPTREMDFWVSHEPSWNLFQVKKFISTNSTIIKYYKSPFWAYFQTCCNHPSPQKGAQKWFLQQARRTLESQLKTQPPSIKLDVTHTIHVWYIYLHLVFWLMFIGNVSKYIPYMDGLGKLKGTLRIPNPLSIKGVGSLPVIIISRIFQTLNGAGLFAYEFTINKSTMSCR